MFQGVLGKALHPRKSWILPTSASIIRRLKVFHAYFFSWIVLTPSLFWATPRVGLWIWVRALVVLVVKALQRTSYGLYGSQLLRSSRKSTDGILGRGRWCVPLIFRFQLRRSSRYTVHFPRWPNDHRSLNPLSLLLLMITMHFRRRRSSVLPLLLPWLLFREILTIKTLNHIQISESAKDIKSFS